MPGWDGFDVPGYLRQTFDVPILVDNDVNAMALGEHHLIYPDVANMMFVKISTGIGARIISDAQLQHGAQGAAGDLGHVAVPDGDQTPCTCGNRGCLEAVASGPAIAAYLRSQGVEVPNLSALLQLVRDGHPEAIQATRGAGRQVGAVLASCVNLLNPSVIVIGGLGLHRRRAFPGRHQGNGVLAIAAAGHPASADSRHAHQRTRRDAGCIRPGDSTYARR